MHLSATWWENTAPLPLTTDLKAFALLKQISFVYFLEDMKGHYIYGRKVSLPHHIIATSGGSSSLSIVATRDELDNFTTCAGASHFKGNK